MSFNATDGIAVGIVEGKGKKAPVYFSAEDLDGRSRIDIPREKGTIVPIPPSVVSKRERDVYFISAPSGAGKSHLAADLLDFYRKTGQRVYVFTPVPDKRFGKDAVYLDIEDLVGVSTAYEKDNARYQAAKIRFKYKKRGVDDPDLLMKLELRLQEMKPDPSKKGRLEMKLCGAELREKFQDCVILMDDYAEGTPGGQIKALEFFRDHFLTTGRHTRTSMIVAHHKTNDREKTKMLMTEATNLVLFCRSTPRSRKYLLKEYFAFDKAQLAKVEERMKARDRWVCLDKELGVLLTPQTAWLS